MTVSEAAAECGISVHALRFYERAAVLVGVPRDSRGRRVYGPVELRAVRFVVRLRATGMPVSDIKRYADLVRAGAGTEEDRLDLLLEHRRAVQQAVSAQQEHLAAIDEKIAHYRRSRPEASASAAAPASERAQGDSA